MRRDFTWVAFGAICWERHSEMTPTFSASSRVSLDLASFVRTLGDGAITQTGQGSLLAICRFLLDQGVEIRVGVDGVDVAALTDGYSSNQSLTEVNSNDWNCLDGPIAIECRGESPTCSSPI